jgi:hypothetical protein
LSPNRLVVSDGCGITTFVVEKDPNETDKNPSQLSSAIWTESYKDTTTQGANRYYSICPLPPLNTINGSSTTTIHPKIDRVVVSSMYYNVRNDSLIASDLTDLMLMMMMMMVMTSGMWAGELSLFTI